MMIEPEFLFIAGFVFVLTGSFWLYREGPLAFTGLSQPRSAKPEFIRGLHSPQLLTVAPALALRPASALGLAAHTLAAPPPAGLANGQLSCLSHIVNAGIATANRAERLHCAAGEQVDGAHYALQNLLDELSGVMAITTASMGRRDNRLSLRPAAAIPLLALAA